MARQFANCSASAGRSPATAKQSPHKGQSVCQGDSPQTTRRRHRGPEPWSACAIPQSPPPPSSSSPAGAAAGSPRAKLGWLRSPVVAPYRDDLVCAGFQGTHRPVRRRGGRTTPTARPGPPRVDGAAPIAMKLERTKRAGRGGHAATQAHSALSEGPSGVRVGARPGALSRQ